MKSLRELQHRRPPDVGLGLSVSIALDGTSGEQHLGNAFSTAINFLNVNDLTNLKDRTMKYCSGSRTSKKNKIKLKLS